MNRKNYLPVAFFVGLFMFFLLYYIVIHPLIPYNSDDWMFMSANRIALPSIHAWNPSRVFPEFLMPLVSELASFLIYPLCHDYFLSQTILHSFVISIFLTSYVGMFYHLLCKRFSVEKKLAIMLSLLFLLFHYLIFRTQDTANVHLFYSNDLTCHYFYLIPNVVNAMLVMSLLKKDWLHGNDFNLVKKGMLLLGVYLAICSNLFCSDILVIFLGTQILTTMPFGKKEAKKYISFVKQNIWIFGIIGFWLFVNLMELMGPRAAYLAKEAQTVGFTSQLVTSIHSILAVRYNVFFVLLALFALAVSVYALKKEKRLPLFTIQLLLSSVITVIYVILVSAKSVPSYSSRPDILFAVFFPIIVLAVLGIVKISRYWEKSIIALPVLLLVLFSQVNRSLPTFADLRINANVPFSYTLETLQRANYDILKQVVAADRKTRVESVSIVVPYVKDDGQNWPYLLIYNNYSNALIQTLYKHGIIEKKFSTTMVVGKKLSEY